MRLSRKTVLLRARFAWKLFKIDLRIIRGHTDCTEMVSSFMFQVSGFEHRNTRKKRKVRGGARDDAQRTCPWSFEVLWSVTLKTGFQDDQPQNLLWHTATAVSLSLSPQRKNPFDPCNLCSK